MANVFNPQTGRWEDPSTGNYLAGGQGNADGTWSGGTWTNPNGGTLGANGQWSDAPQTAPIGAPGMLSPQQQQYNAQGQVYGAQQNQINANQGVVNAQGQLVPLSQAQINANQGVVNAQQATIPLSQAQINAQRGSNAAQGNVLQAQQGTFGPQQAVINANGQVINAQSAYTQAQQGYIGQEQQANTARIGDANAIVQARGNTADQIAVARYNQEQNDLSGRYSAGGISAPIRVATSDNRAGPLAPGVIGDVRTQEQRVTQTANDRETQRGLQLTGAQLAVQLIGTNVDQAREAAARVGLTLDQAQLVVQQAQNAKGYADLNTSNAGINVQQGELGVKQAQIGASQAGVNYNQGQLGVTQAQNAANQAGIGVQQAGLDLNLSKQPPFAGAQPLIDVNTGMQTGWGTPAQADAATAQYRQNVQKAANQQQLQQSGVLGGLSQGELMSMLGNGVLSDDAVRDELVGRYLAGKPDGLDIYAADLLIENYHKSHGDTGGSGGGDSDIYGGGSGSSTSSTSPTTSGALPSATTIGSPTYQQAMEVLQANMVAAGY